MPFIYCFQLSTDTMTQYCTFQWDERGTFLLHRIPVNSAQPSSPQTPPLLKNARQRVFPSTMTLPLVFWANGRKSCPLQTPPLPEMQDRGIFYPPQPLSHILSSSLPLHRSNCETEGFQGHHFPFPLSFWVVEGYPAHQWLSTQDIDNADHLLCKE